MKYAELLDSAAKNIARAAFPNWREPHSELLRLLAFCSQMPPDFSARLQCYQNISARAAQLLGRLQQPAPPELISAFANAVERCCGGEPLPYIMGLAEFSGYIFATGPGALIPRQESEVLLEAAFLFCRKHLEERQNQKLEILELCCGTGCIAISLQQKLAKLVQKLAKPGQAKKPENPIIIWGADISSTALHYAKQNAAYWLGNSDAFSAQIALHLRQSDLFAQKELQRRYDLILANPPYLSGAECERRRSWREPQLALNGGLDGLSVSGRIAEQSGRFLKAGGVLLLEGAPWQMHSLQLQLEANGYRRISRQRDNAGLERVISACWTN